MKALECISGLQAETERGTKKCVRKQICKSNKKVLKPQTQHSCCTQGWVSFPSYPDFSGSSFTTASSTVFSAMKEYFS